MFWLALATCSGIALALEVSLRAVDIDLKAPPPADPYRQERLRKGERLDPDAQP